MMEIHNILPVDVWSSRVRVIDNLALYPGTETIYMPLHEQQYWRSLCKILALISVRCPSQNCETYPISTRYLSKTYTFEKF